MFEITDSDMPITVAEKIITGTKEAKNINQLAKSVASAFTNNPEAGDTEDMFSVDEIREIGIYLLMFYAVRKEKNREDK